MHALLCQPKLLHFAHVKFMGRRNVSILKEKLRTAEEGLKNVEVMTAELLEAREVALSKEQEVDRWKTALGPDNILNTPQDLLIKFSNLQALALRNIKQRGELEAALEFARGRSTSVAATPNLICSVMICSSAIDCTVTI